MARNAADDYTTGRPAKDDQMKAIQKMLGVPKRQSTEPPFVSEKSLEPPGPETREED